MIRLILLTQIYVLFIISSTDNIIAGIRYHPV